MRVVATVLVHDNASSAARVLNAVRAQSRPVDGVILIDNGSAVPLMDALTAAGIILRPDEHVVRSDRNRGVGGGHNLGFRSAQSMAPDLLWILEHDSFADPDCLEVLLAVKGQDDSAIAVPRVARNEYERVLSDRVPLEFPGGAHSTEHGHVLTFNGILLSTSLMDRVGEFREDLHVGFEDRDFVRRVANAGGRLVCPSRTLMIHPTRGNQRFPEPVAPGRLYYSVRNGLWEERESGHRPTLPRVARTLGAAGVDLLQKEPVVARHRLCGLRDGLRDPVPATRTNAARHVRIDVVTTPQISRTPNANGPRPCRACGEASPSIVFSVASWRQLPLLASFIYSQCSSCETLTLIDDADPSEFYNASYDRLRPRRMSCPDARHLLAGEIGRVMARNRIVASTARLDGFLPSWYTWLRGSAVNRDTPILDVGCGNGAMLGHLRSFGFRNLTGIDPFLVSEVTDDGVRLIRAGLSDIPADPQYGLILFNHSLEHLDGPLDALRAACSRLLDGGRIVVSLPIIGGSAWQRYRDNLFSLDAPLHRFVPTPPGMDRLVRRAGAEVIRWVGGSTSWYYLASEAIRRGVNPELVHPRSIFGERQQAWAEQMARRERGREAGEATFLIRPVR